MNKSSKLFFQIVTIFLLVSLLQVECRRTYTTSSSSRGRGNRGKNQPSSGGGLFSSWFGGSKSSSSSSSGSASRPAATPAKKNWQTATSHVSSQPKSSSSWANPYYKPASSGASAPPAPSNYGWKPAGTAAKPANPPYPSSNIGSRGYPVQSGVQQSNVGGFKPVPSVPNTHGTNFQPSQSGFGGYKPSAPSVPNTHATGFQPSSAHHAPGSQSSFGGYHPAPSVPHSGYNPSHSYHAPQPSHGYQPSHGVPHQSYGGSSFQQAGHHPSYPQQPGGFSSHYPTQTNFGYPSHSSFGSSVPTYQGTRLFGGNGNYGYPGSGSWGIDTYGARKSSGTGKLLTGLAVGAAGGYLTSSLVNSISNPWKYSGYGYGSRYGYGSLGGGYGTDLIRRDESAFERGYERGVRDRNENAKETPAPAQPEPEDPTSKWVNCVAFDPQTQQTLINPNCSCTVTTSLDERTNQPISVHHCTTLNGLVMRPIPVQGGMNLPPPPGVAPNGQPPTGVNAPGAVPSYIDSYHGSYGGGGYLPYSPETKTEPKMTDIKPEKMTSEIILPTETNVTNAEIDLVEVRNVTNVESTANTTESGIQSQSTSLSSQPEKEHADGLQGGGGNRQNTASFYGQLQKIVNMGNFVDG